MAFTMLKQNTVFSKNVMKYFFSLILNFRNCVLKNGESILKVCVMKYDWNKKNMAVIFDAISVCESRR